MTNKLRICLYVLLIVLVLADDYKSIVPAGYYWLSKYWYGMAEFAGRQGLKAENKYREEVSY